VAQLRIQAGRWAPGQFHCGTWDGVPTQPSRIRFAGLRPSLTAAARWRLLHKARPYQTASNYRPQAGDRGQSAEQTRWPLICLNHGRIVDSVWLIRTRDYSSATPADISRVGRSSPSVVPPRLTHWRGDLLRLVVSAGVLLGPGRATHPTPTLLHRGRCHSCSTIPANGGSGGGVSALFVPPLGCPESTAPFGGRRLPSGGFTEGDVVAALLDHRRLAL